jgi:hypothetical protein
MTLRISADCVTEVCVHDLVTRRLPLLDARRDVLIARSIEELSPRFVSASEQRRLEEIEVQDNELRVTVTEDGMRYAEHLTLAGVLLERERLGRSR